MTAGKQWCVLVGALLVAACMAAGADPGPASARPGPLVYRQGAGGALEFDWSFLGARQMKRDWELITIQGDTTLRSGDVLLIHVEPQSPCYVYLFGRDEKGKFQVLYPASARELGQALKKGDRIGIPPHGKRMMLDSAAGDETFYLLVSSSRLAGVEDAGRKLSSGVAGGDIDYNKTLLSEIRTVIRSNSDISDSAARIHGRMGGTVATAPGRIAGTYRGSRRVASLEKIDYSEFAVHVKTDNFYSEKIVIHHR